jgi:glycosyltransferase involved in cell wall biosynthesis
MAGGAKTRIALGYAPRPDHHDAILGFTEHLADALSGRPDIAAEVLLRGRRGTWRDADGGPGEPLRAALDRSGSRVLALQYNPFSYGHWGVAPGLIAELVAARRTGALRRLVLVVHEPFVVLPGLRYTLMGGVQRAQLAALLRLADVVLATSEAWVPVLARVRRGTRVVIIPAGSNVPDERAARLDARHALGASSETLVVATFGMTHPQQLVGHVAAALTAALEAGHETVFVALGHAPDELVLRHPRLQIVRPGSQDAEGLARMLAATDLFLAPYADGASSRRTTLMAALQHGLCVVTTRGEHSQPALTERVLASVPVTDRAAFADQACTLAGDRDARRNLGLAAREVYERYFSWDVIGDAFLVAINCGDETG